jgi:hypothetical protein
MTGTDQPSPISADDEEASACLLDAVEQASLMVEYGSLARTAVVGVRRSGSMLEVSVSRSAEAEARVERIVDAERACCPFMDVAVRGDGGTLVVTYSGPAAIEPVLDMIESRVRPPAWTNDPAPRSLRRPIGNEDLLR